MKKFNTYSHDNKGFRTFDLTDKGSPVITQWDNDWMNVKLSMMNSPGAEILYNFATFGKKNKMTIKGEIQSNGLCIIEVLLFKQSNSNDIVNYPIKGMIDTGATYTVISSRITNLMQLDRKDAISEIRGFDTSQMKECTEVHLNIPGLFGENSLFIKAPIKEDMEKSGFDTVIGADILNHILFTRDGQNKTFTLEFK